MVSGYGNVGREVLCLPATRRPACRKDVIMTLHPRDPTTMPADIAAVGDAVLGPTNPYRVLGDQLADMFSDVQFAPLYTPHGRAAISPSILALVTIFQFLENVPDRQAAELRQTDGRQRGLSGGPDLGQMAVQDGARRQHSHAD